MGIKSINKTVKLHAPSAFETKPLSYFNGYRIAIDGNEKAYAATATVCKRMIASMPDPLAPFDRETMLKKVANALLQFSIQLMEKNIIPVWCWDGIAPPEKAYIRGKRKGAKDKLRDKITAAKALVETTNIFARTPQAVENYKKLLAQDTTVSTDEMKQLSQIMGEFGLPSIQAPNEGEKLASALAREGLVAASWTTDTDTYLLGAPIMITDFSGYQCSDVSIVNIPKMLDQLTTTFAWDKIGHRFCLSSLIDLGIMHGTDFNPNIRLVGPVKSVKYIQQCGSIEQVAINNPKIDISVLNHVRTREIFQYEASGYSHSSVELNVNKAIDPLNPLEKYDCLDLSTAFTNVRTSLVNTPNKYPIVSYPSVIGPKPEECEIPILPVVETGPSVLPTFS